MPRDWRYDDVIVKSTCWSHRGLVLATVLLLRYNTLEEFMWVYSSRGIRAIVMKKHSSKRKQEQEVVSSSSPANKAQRERAASGARLYNPKAQPQ